jgi:peptide/nickel transport system substrate-binding protein
MYAALHTGGSTNAFGFSDPTIDRLLDEARATTSTATRKALYDQIQLRLVNDGGPMIYTYASYLDYAMSPRLHGYTYVPRASYQNLAEAWLQ